MAETQYQHFHEHFWGEGGWEHIEKRSNSGIDSISLFLNFFEGRIGIEEKYCKDTKKMLENTNKASEFGTAREVWLNLRAESEGELKMHEELSAFLQKEVPALKKFVEDQKKLRKTALSDGSKANKERHDLEKAHGKLKSKCSDVEKRLKKADSALAKATNENKPSLIAKKTQKVQTVAKTEMLLDQEVKEHVQAINTFWPTWIDRVSNAMQSIQNFEVERINYIKTFMDGYYSVMTDHASRKETGFVNLKQKVDEMDSGIDISAFIFDNQTGPSPPEPPVYVSKAERTGAIDAGSDRPSPPIGAGMPFDPPKETPAPYTPKGEASAEDPSAGSNFKAQKVEALYDYVGSEADELDFVTGDTFTLVSKDDSGWWVGVINGRKGFFPSNYVREL